MIIKAMRLQAWAPAGGWGKSKPSPPPLEKKKFFGYIRGLFATFSLYGALFATFLGAFSPCGSLFAPFYFMVGAFLGACPPPYENFCGLPHDCKEGSRACSPEFFCVTTI